MGEEMNGRKVNGKKDAARVVFCVRACLFGCYFGGSTDIRMDVFRMPKGALFRLTRVRIQEETTRAASVCMCVSTVWRNSFGVKVCPEASWITTSGITEPDVSILIEIVSPARFKSVLGVR